jgi:hypothetical protein
VACPVLPGWGSGELRGDLRRELGSDPAALRLRLEPRSECDRGAPGEPGARESVLL